MTAKLLKEVAELPDPMRNLLTHNEQELIGFCQRLGARIAELEPAGPRWRHVTRGTTYTEIGRGFAQASVHPIEDMTAVVIYRNENGTLWVRNAVEFDDGRFEELT